MVKGKGKDPNFVSVRLPADVSDWLREYATANNLTRQWDGETTHNMGGSIIAIIRSVMQGLTISDNVGHSENIDIQAIIDNAIATAKIEIESDYMLAIIDAKHEMRKFVIDAMIPDPTNEEAIAPDPAAPSIESAIPDKTFWDAIATEPATKPKKKKQKAIELTAQEAYELAQARGFTSKIETFKQNFSRKGDDFGSKYGLSRKQKDGGVTSEYFYYDTQTP